MQAMFETLAPRLQGGRPVLSIAIHVTSIAEGVLAEGLSRIQAAFEDVDIGSYPYYRASGNGVAVVARGTDPERLDDAIIEVRSLMLSLGGSPIPGEPRPATAHN
jgi:molybdopterin-biosynthesis enzyme MoeA-like protein